MISTTTATQQKMKRQIASIYQSLIKHGYPQLVNKNILKSQSQIEQFLSQYFQPTPKRQNVIQWLILQIYPIYQGELDKADKKSNKKRKILTYLWKLGVMPYSKHTKNLDYQKYIQGLIGIQNSINLIYNLCTLMGDSKKYSKSKMDNQFHYFLQDLYKNYESLINIEYDPYKISFPASYQQLSEEQFNDHYQAFLNQKIHKISKDKIEKIKQTDSSFQSVFRDFQEHKVQFQRVYSVLSNKIKQTITQNKSLLQSYQHQEASQLKGRTINMSSNLSKLYKQYKQKIRYLSYTTSNIDLQKQQMIDLIVQLNEKVAL